MGFSEKQLEALNSPITGDVVKERKGPGGKMLSYLPAFHVIDRANEIFGFDGWSCETTSLNSRVDNNGNVVTTAQVRVSVLLRVPTGEGENAFTDHVRIERMGVGHGSSKSAYDYEFAEKEAESDAMKRAFRTFGPQFGNSLYDKEVLAELGKTSEDAPSAPRSFGGSRSSAPSSGGSSGGGSDRPASDKQVRFIEKLLAEREKTLADFGISKDASQLSAKEASNLLDKIQGK